MWIFTYLLYFPTLHPFGQCAGIVPPAGRSWGDQDGEQSLPYWK